MLAKMITAFAFYFFYWFCCFLGTGTDQKNLAGLRSYSDAVQQAVREHSTLGKNAPQAKSIISILIGNLLLFTVVFSVLGFALKNILRLDGFWNAFWFFLALGEGLGLFGPVLPMWFMKDAYIANLEARGKDAAYISGLFANINMTTFVIAVVATLVCGLLGGWFGQKMVKKHFAKAGIV